RASRRRRRVRRTDRRGAPPGRAPRAVGGRARSRQWRRGGIPPVGTGDRRVARRHPAGARRGRGLVVTGPLPSLAGGRSAVLAVTVVSVVFPVASGVPAGAQSATTRNPSVTNTEPPLAPTTRSPRIGTTATTAPGSATRGLSATTVKVGGLGWALQYGG